MSFRDALAIHVAPIPLRLVLAITFVWAGLGKVTQEMEVSGESAAILANMGVITPARVGPEVIPAPVPEVPSSAAEPSPQPARDDGAATEGLKSGPPVLMALSRIQQAGSEAPSSATAPPAGQAAPVEPLPSPGILLPPPPTYTAADFPEPVKVRSVNGLALMLHKSAFPASTDGKPGMELWPPTLAEGAWPVGLAWAVALTELIGGLFVFVGFLTRLSALGLMGVMFGAMWLTVFGPAIQSGNAQFGFLPNYATFDIAAWRNVMWQFSLAAGSLSLALLGSGALALDRALFIDRPSHRPARTPATPA